MICLSVVIWYAIYIVKLIYKCQILFWYVICTIKGDVLGSNSTLVYILHVSFIYHSLNKTINIYIYSFIKKTITIYIDKKN